MKKTLGVLAITLVALVLGVTQSESQPGRSRYPNELPNLKLYEDAKWKTLKPYISTVDDVVSLLGEPVPILDDRSRGDVQGYEYDPDWTVVVDVLGSDPDLKDSVRGRFLNVVLYPKKRVSVVGADFSEFKVFSYTNSRQPNVEGTVYYDKFGLRYSVHAKDTPDGRFHAGDLESIIYGPSDEEKTKFKRTSPATR
jgi:hypothetical protein